MSRPQKTYTYYEWEEKRKIAILLWKIIKTMPTTIQSDMNWNTMMTTPNPTVVTTSEEATSLHTTLLVIKTDPVFKTADNELLLVFLKGGLYRPWNEELHEELDERLSTSITNLINEYPIPQPKKTDICHAHHKEKSSTYNNNGVYYLCF